MRRILIFFMRIVLHGSYYDNYNFLYDLFIKQGYDYAYSKPIILAHPIENIIDKSYDYSKRRLCLNIMKKA